MTRDEIVARIKSHWRLKLLLSIVLTNVFTASYLLLQHFLLFPVTQLQAGWVDRAIPFAPDAVYLYVTLWLLMPIGPWLMRSKRDLGRYAASFAVMALAGFCVFFFFPTSNPRPQMIHDANVVYQALCKVDLPLNSFPSLHVALAVFSGAWCHAVAFAGNRRGKIRWLIWVWIVAIIASTLLTKQHVFVDIVAGVGLGFGGFAIGWSLRSSAPEPSA